MPQIDTIAKHIINLNHQLIQVSSEIKSLNDSSKIDLIFKILTALITLGSVLIALSLFFLNQKKEFHIKKAELAGFIYMNIFEFKRLRNNSTKYRIQFNAFRHAKKKFDNVNDIKIFFEHFKIDTVDLDEFEKINAEMDIVRKELLKYVGTYGFYCDINTKKILKENCQDITNDRFIKIDFSQCKTQNNILKQYDDVYNTVVNAELVRTREILNPIEKIIDNESM